jgi:hypothetical protein
MEGTVESISGKLGRILPVRPLTLRTACDRRNADGGEEFPS